MPSRHLPLVPVLIAAALAACDPDPRPVCTEAYKHLIVLGQRQDDPELASRFVEACAEAYDPERLKCLSAARSAGEALACKAVRKRPG